MTDSVCKCPITPGMNEEQLREIVHNRQMCTDVPGKRWMCPELDKRLVKAKKEGYWRKSQARKLKRAGYTAEEIKKMPQKSKKGYAPATVVTFDLTSDLF